MKKVSLFLAKSCSLRRVLAYLKRSTIFDSEYGNLPSSRSSALIWMKRRGQLLAEEQLRGEKEDPSMVEKRWKLLEAEFAAEMTTKLGRIAEVHGISEDEAKDAFTDGWEILVSVES